MVGGATVTLSDQFANGWAAKQMRDLQMLGQVKPAEVERKRLNSILTLSK
jgi:hypothetical protein